MQRYIIGMPKCDIGFIFCTKKAVNFFCSWLRFSTTYHYEQESSRRSWAFLLSCVMIVEIVEITAIQKKSEYASICLYYNNLLFLCHILLFLFHNAKVHKISQLFKIISTTFGFRPLRGCSSDGSRSGSDVLDVLVAGCRHWWKLHLDFRGSIGRWVE